MVSFRDVTKSYLEGSETRVILKNFSGALAAHQIHAVIGQSGSGKSTLLNLISGLDRPSSGDVIVAGENLTHLSETKRTLFRRRHVGFIFQFFNLLPTLTVSENIRLPLELLGEKKQLPRVNQLLEQVGLLDRAGSFPENLSGGEQQRVALCRALVHRPSLILADEPTGNLDEAAGERILKLLQEVCRREQASLVLVTHSKKAAAIADTVYEMRSGAGLVEARA